MAGGNKYAGADWIKAQLKYWTKKNQPPRQMSPLGEAVADLLGDAWFGIYHLDHGALSRVEWENDHHVEVVLYGDLCTHDNSRLTQLVILCHDRCLRLELEAAAHNYLRLVFYQRSRDGNLYNRHPTLEEQIERWRGHYDGGSELLVLRPEVYRFAVAIERLLRGEIHDDGDVAPVDYLERIGHEVEELDMLLLEAEPAEEVTKRAVAIAKYAMLLADRAEAIDAEWK